MIVYTDEYCTISNTKIFIECEFYIEKSGFPLMNILMLLATICVSSLQGSATDKPSNVVFQGDLLDRLPNWLDRLFEGTTHRYYINYWPDFAPK